MPSTRIGTPNGVKLKNWKPVGAAGGELALTTRFGAVATRVIMPLISAATLSGIISRLGAVPVFWAMRSTIGMKMATTPVELITAPSPATTSHQQDEQASLAAAGPGHQPVAEPLGDAGPHQPLADDEQQRRSARRWRR